MDKKTLFCHVCGKESTPYPLCPDCFKLRDDGKIIKCDKCGVWHLKWSVCNCLTNHTHKEASSPDPRKTTTCLICKQYSYGEHFCEDCASRYRDRSFDMRIKNLAFEKIVDEWGNLDMHCINGHCVRSRAEKIIADFFFENRIRYIYEKPIYYKDEAGEEKELRPDFFLPDFDTYIEYNELKGIDYLKKKRYAIAQYRKYGLKLRIVTNKGLLNLSKTFKKFLTIN